MPDDRRRAIAVYLELLKGGQQSGRRVTVKRPLHPHVARSLEILKPYFASTTLKTQDTFSNAEQAERLLKLLPDQALANALRKKWDQESSDKASSKRRWADIDEVAKTMLARGGSKSANADARALLEAKQEIVLEYTYPRLDAEVSKKLIHLLKSPFVVHPGTGRVCVPIDVRRLDQFDPLSVPKVGELIVEINDYDASHQNGGEDGGDENVNGDSQSRKIQDYEKTSLKPYVDYFRTFVAGLLKNERDLKRARGEVDDEGTGDAMEF
ncbi:hypothetical protein KEM55_008786 [Ascosphaera atra]|nr:hypothetical protein KEM55_008786 [Ascosphaera atra]